MDFYDNYTTEQLFAEAETLNRILQKSKHDYIVNLLHSRVNMIDWSENEDPDWPERLLEL